MHQQAGQTGTKQSVLPGHLVLVVVIVPPVQRAIQVLLDNAVPQQIRICLQLPLPFGNNGKRVIDNGVVSQVSRQMVTPDCPDAGIRIRRGTIENGLQPIVDITDPPRLVTVNLNALSAPVCDMQVDGLPE
jgi:hypothetical protein